MKDIYGNVVRRRTAKDLDELGLYESHYTWVDPDRDMKYNLKAVKQQVRYYVKARYGRKVFNMFFTVNKIDQENIKITRIAK